MTLRPLRLLVAAMAALALALPAAGLAQDRLGDRGIVQSVDSSQIVLTRLDGSVASFAVSPSTRVRLNGARATLTDIHPGYVAMVLHEGGAPALLIRAFGQALLTTDRGLVTALTRSSITLRSLDGATIVVSLDQNTQVRFLGLPVRRFLVRPGAFVAVMHGPDGPAKLVNVLKRTGA